ncbi:MAG: 4,5-DOPA dioxygenase extradiol [Gemmatimonadota bacterium]
MARMPVLFVGHGSPMNVVLDNPYTRSLRALSRTLPRPEAVCVVSAHWLTRGTFVSCQARPRQIYDFSGFPPALSRVRYEPPGHPALARRTVALLSAEAPGAGCNADWGHDHAGWSVLRHLYPDADVPVYLVSVDMTVPAARHAALGRLLGPLRDDGVLVLGSGNIVHNLRRADFDDSDAPPDPPGVAFDASVRDALSAGDLAALVGYARLGAPARYAVPTPDHYFPVLYAAALRDSGEPLRFPCEIFQNRSVSMRSFAIGEA